MTAAPRAVDGRGGRSLPELRFIAARVIAEVRANPPRGPLLTDVCPRCGGSDWGERTNGRRYCLACIRKPKGRRG